MDKKILICENEEGYIFFDAEKVWFYFLDKNSHTVNPILMYRPGNYNITEEDTEAIQQWLREHLKDGILQSRQATI